MFTMDRRLKRKHQYSMLTVPTTRQYPLHEVLYRQLTPKAKLPKVSLRRKVVFIKLVSDSGDDKYVGSPTASNQRSSTTPYSSIKLKSKANFSEYVRLTLARKREKKSEEASKEVGEKLSYNDLVYSTMLRQAKRHKARSVNFTESSALETKAADIKFIEEKRPSITIQPMQLPESRYSISSSSPACHFTISSSSLPPEKLVRRVVNLPKSPFGVHKDFAFDLRGQYVSPERSSTWLNINNSKRTAPRRKRTKG
jgi:hypothetical protein